MSNRNCIANLLVAACFLFVGTHGPVGLKTTFSADASSAVIDLKPPVTGTTTDRHYTMTARVRPLLFWISRSGVGGARISWLESTDGAKGLELLVGSDPARTPMRVNRWGYVAERVAGSSADLIGVMTESEEKSIDQAAAKETQPGGTHAFKAIRGRLAQGLAQSTVMRLLLTDDFTYREADALLRRLPTGGAPTRQVSVPKGAEPGFLFAVKGMVHDSVENYRKNGVTGYQAQMRSTYIYDATLYELFLKSSRFLKTTQVDGREYRAVIESQFETRNTRTGNVTVFSITYGTESPYREIPICIVYQPRWWFEAELRLESDSATAVPAARSLPWMPGLH